MGRALCLALLVAGCAPIRPAGPDPAVARQLLSSAAAQVKRCYRVARLGSAARQIGTVLAVRYAADGTLAGPPRLVRQTGVTPANAPFAGRMAEAASLAVVRCQPLRLPAEQYGLWDDFELTFTMSVAA